MKRKLPIFYSAMLLTGVNLLLRLAGTSFQVFISGRIGAAGVGLLQLVLSVGGLANTAAMAGIRTTAMYLTAEELGRKHLENVARVLSACFTYSILCSGLASLLLGHFAPLIADKWVGYPETLEAIRLLGVFLPVNCLCGVMTGYFTAANRIGMLAAVEVGEQVCSMVLTSSLLFVWAGAVPGKACQAVVLGSGVSACVTLAVLVILRHAEHSGSGPALPIAGRLAKIALPLAVGDVMKAGLSTLENLMVPKRLRLYPTAEDPLAAFGVVCGMVFPVLMFPAAILFGLCELLIPELARCNAAGTKRRISHLAEKSLHISMLYGCSWAGLLYLLGNPLCMMLYGNEEAGQYLQRFALLAPMLYCDAVTDAMVKGLGQQKITVVFNILTAGMDVAFLYFLLPRYGMEGYFFSFLVTHGVNFLLSLWLLGKLTGPVLPRKKGLLCLAATLLGVLAGRFLPGWWRGAAFLVVFSCLAVLFGVVKRTDVLWLKGVVTGKGHEKRP